MNLQENTVKMLTTLNTENGPVFKPEAVLETVQASDNITVGKSQFGYFLNIKLGDTSRLVNVRNVKPTDAQPLNFKLEVWKAIRNFKPTTPNSKEIKLGEQRVFAVPA